MSMHSKRRGALPGQNMSRRPLVAMCYSIVILVFLLVCTFHLISDSIARSDGSLRRGALKPDAFAMQDIQPGKEGLWHSTNSDPQMVLDVATRQVNTLHFAAEYSLDPYEICLYYTTDDGEEFGDHKRVWPVQQNDGSYLFTLPRGHIQRIRLDPASRILDVRFGAIVLNEPAPAYQYFNPGWAGLVMLLTLPALGAAALRWALDTLHHYYAIYTGQKWLRKKKRDLQAKKEGASDE